MLSQEEYEARRQKRYDHLLEAARKAERESQAAHTQSDAISSMIPLGQPILVGHYSEARHRRALETIRSKARKGYELAKLADEYRSRAASIEANTAIFSDDPQAIEKLGGKIAQLKARQERMKAVNKLVRKNDREGLAAMGYTDKQIDSLMTPDSCGRVGYPDYAITNNGAALRNARKRAERVAAMQATEDYTKEINGVKIEYSPSENRIRAKFPARVSKDVYNELRRNGFRYAPSFEGFSAYHNSGAKYTIERIAGEYKAEDSHV
mgnify:CR=1 FL=1